MIANVNDFRENNFFPVFDCILENSLKNILQCLEQRKMKGKKKNRNPLQSANPPPQSTKNPPQTTIKKPTNPPSQHIRARVPPCRPQSQAHRPHQPPRRVWIWGGVNRRGMTQSGEREIDEAHCEAQ
jgi:hypothetical protein